MIKWKQNPDMVAYMMEIIPGHEEGEIRAMFLEKFGIVLTKMQIKNFKINYHISSGTHGGRFPKGQIPHNKGKKMSPEAYAKAAPTMFKKGHRPVNHKEIGSERVNIYGYIEVKVAEPNKWKLKHRIIWEQVNGAIPKGHNVQFRNHNSLDCRIENLYLISKAEQIRTENSYHRYPKEIQELIHLKGVINRQIHKAERNGK